MLSIYGSWFGYEGYGLEASIRMVAQAGFEGVLLWWSDEYNRPNYKKQPDYARKAGLFVENIHAPFGDITQNIWADNEAGQATFECYMQCVEDCANYEIPAMVLHVSRSNDLPLVSDPGLNRLKRIADRAEQRGINIAIENLRTAEAITRATYVLEQIDAPRLGFCFDAGHHNARLVAETDMLAQFGHRLMALHLHDNDGTDDQHLLPFDGTTDWPALMQRIRQTGYTGPTTLEVVCEGYQDRPPEEFLALAYERVKKLDELRNLKPAK